jgi:hypothetical protein
MPIVMLQLKRVYSVAIGAACVACVTAAGEMLLLQLNSTPLQQMAQKKWIVLLVFCMFERRT